jgi:DNA-binding transcriptional MocR family regulator
MGQSKKNAYEDRPAWGSGIERCVIASELDRKAIKVPMSDGSNRPLSKTAKHLFRELAMRCSNDKENGVYNVTFVGENRLAQYMECSLSTVKRAMAELKAVGLVKTKKRTDEDGQELHEASWNKILNFDLALRHQTIPTKKRGGRPAGDKPGPVLVQPKAELPEDNRKLDGEGYDDDFS